MEEPTRQENEETQGFLSEDERQEQEMTEMRRKTNNDGGGGPAPAGLAHHGRDEEWGEEGEDDDLSMEDHAQVVLAILKPVAITMLLVIWAVRVITIPSSKNFT